MCVSISYIFDPTRGMETGGGFSKKTSRASPAGAEEAVVVVSCSLENGESADGEYEGRQAGESSCFSGAGVRSRCMGALVGGEEAATAYGGRIDGEGTIALVLCDCEVAGFC